MIDAAEVRKHVENNSALYSKERVNTCLELIDQHIRNKIKEPYFVNDNVTVVLSDDLTKHDIKQICEQLQQHGYKSAYVPSAPGDSYEPHDYGSPATLTISW